MNGFLRTCAKFHIGLSKTERLVRVCKKRQTDVLFLLAVTNFVANLIYHVRGIKTFNTKSAVTFFRNFENSISAKYGTPLHVLFVVISLLFYFSIFNKLAVLWHKVKQSSIAFILITFSVWLLFSYTHNAKVGHAAELAQMRYSTHDSTAA